jgi:putative iron-only hydrogenase system regulator
VETGERSSIVSKRLGFVGIILENRKAAAVDVNRVLSEFGDLICARMGLPYAKRSCCVITLIVDATTDELGRLTGRLGMLRGVSVKSALGKAAAKTPEKTE